MNGHTTRQELVAEAVRINLTCNKVFSFEIIPSSTFESMTLSALCDYLIGCYDYLIEFYDQTREPLN